MVFSNNLLLGAVSSAAADAYLIEQSLLFNSADSAYLNRTPSSTGDTKTWTFSAWVKFASGTNYNMLMGHRRGGGGASNQTQVTRSSSGALMFYNSLSGSTDANLSTEAVFRDTSAWYHIVYIVDTTEATDTNRVKIIVNGTQQTIAAGADWPALNATTRFNEASRFMYVGALNDAADNPYLFHNGLMAEVHFVDGTALAATNFGETDDNGFWNPIEYTGSYGTNGFQLKFADTAAFGDDTSGNTNDYTPNNFTATDQFADVPTNDADAGIGNFATLNPNTLQADATLAEGNLKITASDTTVSSNGGEATISLSSGKWFWYSTCASFAADSGCGVYDSSSEVFANVAANTGSNHQYAGALDTTTFHRAWALGSGQGDISLGFTADVNNDLMIYALDVDNNSFWTGIYDDSTNTLYWRNANTNMSGDPTDGGTTASMTLTSGGSWTPFAFSTSSSAAGITLSFDTAGFPGVIPTGYKAIATQNLPVGAPLYTGNATQYRVGAPIINPFTDLSNAVHGWRADLGLTLTGSSVDQWDDQIGSWDLVDGGTKPTVLSSNINGLDAISFPGDGGNLSVSSVTLTMPYTMLMVMKQISWMIYGYPFGVFTQKGLQQRSSTPQLTQGDNLANTNSAATVGSYFPIMAEFGNTTSDFLQIGDTKVEGTASGNSSISSSTFMLGAAQSSPPSNRSANVAYAEFIIVDGAISEFDLANYRAYVKDRYGV